MKAIERILVGIAIISLAQTAAGAESRSRLGAGLEYGFATDDTDNMPGVYLTYDIDLPDPVSLRIGVNHFQGDYDIPASHGSFKSTGLELLFYFSGEVGPGTLYGGAGAGHYFNDFSNIEFPDKLGMLFVAGWRIPTSDRLVFDTSLMHRSLQPDHLDPIIGEVIMDAWVLRVGICYDL